MAIRVLAIGQTGLTGQTNSEAIFTSATGKTAT
jgi:hypothetical protein